MKAARLVSLVPLLGGIFLNPTSFAGDPPDREGLLLEYRFEEDGMSDTSGNGMDGVPKGEVLPAEGKEGKGVMFDGNISYVETPLKTSDLPDTFTVECWVKPDASENLYADICGNHAGDTLNNTAGGFVMQQDGENTNRYVAAYGAGGTWVATMPVALTADEWQHVAIVKSKETLSFYLNGEEAASVPAPDPMVPSPIPLRIGLGYPATDRTFRGCIDEFRVWNRAIPPK